MSAPTMLSRDRIVVSTLRCGRNNPGSNPGHGRKIFNEKLISEHAKWQSSATSCLRTILFYTFLWVLVVYAGNVAIATCCALFLISWFIVHTSSHFFAKFYHQDGRVVKALDLSSNGRLSAWVRTPLLVICLALKRKNVFFVSLVSPLSCAIGMSFEIYFCSRDGREQN